MVSMRDEVMSAAEDRASRAGLPIGAFLTQVIENAVAKPNGSKVSEAFRIADELNLKGPREWKREDLYDG